LFVPESVELPAMLVLQVVSAAIAVAEAVRREERGRMERLVGPPESPGRLVYFAPPSRRRTSSMIALTLAILGISL
jgi:hypothetical protein